VVNISSVGGVQGSMKFAGLSAYSSSKAALNILTEMLAEEYKDRKIHFNSLALGSVETKMLKKAFPDFKASTSAIEMANYIYQFSVDGYMFLNGKIVSVSSTTP
jgi:NAD(P)-dependent dehydrogenase (short-subunit alcohol dehydrogenase family)